MLGPVLFLLYTADLSELTAKHGVALNAFAYDTQLHLHCNSTNLHAAIGTLESCVKEVSHWIIIIIIMIGRFI